MMIGDSECFVHASRKQGEIKTGSVQTKHTCSFVGPTICCFTLKGKGLLMIRLFDG